VAKRKTSSSKTTSRKSNSAKKATTSKKTRTSARRKTSADTKDQTQVDVGDEEVTIDRRRGNRRASAAGSDPTAKSGPSLEKRQKVNRRRQIDPTTCERDYSDDEVEFMNALDDYKRKSGRMFPTCSEVLEVIRDLGYTKLTAGEPLPPVEADDASEERPPQATAV